jgi:hypothetical protein
MRTFLVRRGLVFGALFAALGFASAASAQTYDFTFSCGAGCGITDGVIVVSGGQIVSVSGDASGLFSDEEITGGEHSWSLADGDLISNSEYYNSSGDYEFVFDVYAQTGYDDVDLDSGNGTLFDSRTGTGEDGFSTAQEVASPAPTPGAGWLSWLALAGVGLAVWRQRLAAAAGRLRAQAS